MRRMVAMMVLLVSAVAAPVAGGAAEGTGAVYGEVIDAVTERPVADVCVRVYGAEMTPTEFSAVSNSDGGYEIGGLPPGEYILEFDDCEADAYATVHDAVIITAGKAVVAHQFLALNAGYGSIVGFVHDEESFESIAGICVDLFMAADDILVTRTLTGSDGGFQLNPPVGDYRVRFKGCEGNSYETQWYDGAAGWETSSVVSVADHQVVLGIDAAMVPVPVAEGAVVWGYVVDGVTAEGVAGYCVSVYHGETKVSTVLTGPDGGYEMEIDSVETRLKAWACEGHDDLGTVWYIDGLEFGDADGFVPAAGQVTQLETIVVGDVRFSDAIDSIFHSDIVWLAQEGVTAGCNASRTLFCPGAPVTRGQMAAFIHRALGDVLEPKGEVTFTDDDGSIFEADIEWLASVGVTDGCGDGTYCPDDKVTRAQMAAFLHRALGDILVGEGTIDFADDDGSIFEEDIEWLASVGVTTGCGEADFCPQDHVTRAQMAAFLHRALGK